MKDIIITVLLFMVVVGSIGLDWGLHPSWLIVIIPAWVWYLWGAHKDKL